MLREITYVFCKVIGMSEMVTYLPITSPFVRFAGRFVDEAFGVAIGWNFFVFEAAMVPFEVVACNFIINFWSDAVPTAAIVAIIILLYGFVYHYLVLIPQAPKPTHSVPLLLNFLFFTGASLPFKSRF